LLPAVRKFSHLIEPHDFPQLDKPLLINFVLDVLVLLVIGVSEVVLDLSLNRFHHVFLLVLHEFSHLLGLLVIAFPEFLFEVFCLRLGQF